MISEFEIQDNVELTINDKKFFFTHGHKYNIDNIPDGINVLVYGHFHTGFIKEKDGVIVVNAGSISLPKENTANSYLIIDDKEIKLYDVEGNLIDKKIY
jgi:predicted phosphodiesterase